MWRRVLFVLVAYSTIVVLGLAIPLAVAVSRERGYRLSESRTNSIGYFANLAARDSADGVDRQVRDSEIRTAVGRYHDLYGEGAVIVDRAGAVRTAVGLDPREPSVAAAISAALRNQRSEPLRAITPWSPSSVLIAVPVGSGTQVDGAVVLEVSTRAAARDVTRAWGVVAAGAAAALLVGSAIAVALSRWVVRPLTGLAAQVRELGERVDRGVPHLGRSAAPVDDAGPPEVRELARAFDTMSSDVERAWQSQRRLVADTSHALRNPLAALRIRLEAVKIGAVGQAAERTERAIAEVDRLTGIVDGLLRLASAESQSDADAGRHCRVDHVLADREDAWREAFRRAGIDYTSRRVPEDLPEAAISDRSLGQVFDVLFGNAVAYAGAGATVAVRVERVVDGVRIDVSDTGSGLPAAELDRAPDRFFRGSTASGEGTGLGLAIARAAVEQVGGRLVMKANDPHGLVVRLTLPLS